MLFMISSTDQPNKDYIREGYDNALMTSWNDRFSDFHLADNAKLVSPVPGEKSKRLLDIQNLLEGSIVSYPKSMPIGIKRAKGAIVEDLDGNLFIDFFSGAGVL